MRLISTVRADASSTPQKTETAKPVPQDTPESNTAETDDIPDQEVANQTKFIKSVQENGATRSLVVFGLAAGYLASTSGLAIGATEAYGTEALKAEVLTAAIESLQDTVKSYLAEAVRVTRDRTAAVLDTFNHWLKDSIHYVAHNPKKVATAIALLGGVLVIGTKMRSSLSAIKAQQDPTLSPDKQVAPIRVLFDNMQDAAKRRMLAVTDTVDAKAGTNFRDTMGLTDKEVPIEVFQFDSVTGEVKLVIETKGVEVKTTQETMTLRKRLGEVLEMIGRLFEYVAEIQYSVSGKIKDYYKTNMQLVNGVHRNDNGTFEFKKTSSQEVGTGLMGLVKYTGAFALLYALVNYVKGIYRWATKPSEKPKETPGHEDGSNHVHAPTAA